MTNHPDARPVVLASACAAMLALGCSPDASAPAPVPEVAAQQSALVATSFGDPLPGLTATELAAFQAGRAAFIEEEDVADGLGPIFNERSCGNCHDAPAVGGSSAFAETRFGVLVGQTFDPLVQLGGSLLQDFSIGTQGTPPGCFFPTEVVPRQANHTALRRSLPLFGLGLVDAVPDAELKELAALERV